MYNVKLIKTFVEELNALETTYCSTSSPLWTLKLQCHIGGHSNLGRTKYDAAIVTQHLRILTCCAYTMQKWQCNLGPTIYIIFIWEGNFIFDTWVNCFGRDMSFCRQKHQECWERLVCLKKSFIFFCCSLFFSCICWSHPGEEVLQRLWGGHSHFPPGQPVTAAATHHGEETSTQCVRWGRGFPSKALLLSSDAFKNGGLTNSWFYILDNSLCSILFAPPQGGTLFSWTWKKLWRLQLRMYVTFKCPLTKMRARRERPAALLVLLEDMAFQQSVGDLKAT